MSALVAPDSTSPDSLDMILARAGAVFSDHSGHRVAMNFGSAAAELAVCVRAVGLLNRSELCKLEIEAPASRLSRLLSWLAGSEPAAGGVVNSGSAWWCRATDERVMVLAEPEAGARLHAQLRSQASHRVATRVTDRTQELGAIALIGPGTLAVLRAAGVFEPSGDPRAARPFTTGSVDGVEVSWLLQSDHRALAIAPRALAGRLWLALESIGRPFGLACVGDDAARRFSLLERSREHRPGWT